ncbi:MULTISPECIES: porin [unclassified Bradyrhizobium]|uniref:porin n=1 Tax=unclassified Bradyrhizobium TaxID=2631580 RepID=UPI0003F858C2|nr:MULTISPECIES: porin [unclassified Bradyrhizobium]MCP3465695.1 porin [Bradyrhizobium sp. CCGUVB23]
MKLTKSLMLGSAAALIAVGGAQAADLPVKAKAVEYVKICSLYGAGFYYMPGTDTCIKFGGYVRADTSVGAGDYSFQQGANQGSNNRLTNYWYSRARMDLTVDTRTATEYGVVRTYADMVFTWTSNTVSGSNGSAQGAADGSASLGLYHAFIQFAGFTFGRTVSVFDAPWQSYPAGGPDTIPGGSNHVTGVNQVAYTADFGQGITGSIALQDITTSAGGNSNLWNLSGATAANMVQGIYGTNDWGGTRSPDIVGAIRVDQAWGLAQISVAAHDMHPAYYGATELTGHPADKWGWAIQGALSIKNIPTGPGDSINLQAVYTDGASRYNFQSLFPQTFFMYSGSGIGAYQSVGIAGIADGVFTTGSSIESVKTWGFRGGYTHNWTPNVASGIYGGYGSVRYGDGGKTAICANAVTLLGLVGTCNPDFNFAVIGVNTVWTPVKNLAFTADVNWSHLDQKYSGTIASPGVAAAAKPAGVYELKDQSSVSMLLRAQRNF